MQNDIFGVADILCSPFAQAIVVNTFASTVRVHTPVVDCPLLYTQLIRNKIKTFEHNEAMWSEYAENILDLFEYVGAAIAVAEKYERQQQKIGTY